MKPFTLRGMFCGVRPFVNIACRGDGVSLLASGEQVAPLQTMAVDKGGDTGVADIGDKELASIRAEADAFWD